MRKPDTLILQSSLFRGAEKSALKIGALRTLLVFFVLWGGSLLAGRFLFSPLLSLMPADTPLLSVLAASARKILICGVQIAAFFLWVRFVEKRKVHPLGFDEKKRGRAYFSGAALGIFAVLLIVAVLQFTGSLEVRPAASLSPGTGLLALLSVAGWAVQSASEEIAVRGWLIPTLGVRLGPLAAVLLTGGVFGVLHLLNPGVSVLSFINLCLSGFFFALFAIYSGDLLGVCGLHMGWNFAQSSLFGLSVSGEPGSIHSVFSCTQRADSFWTGGAFGPEGSFVTTLFLLTGVLILCACLVKKARA